MLIYFCFPLFLTVQNGNLFNYENPIQAMQLNRNMFSCTQNLYESGVPCSPRRNDALPPHRRRLLPPTSDTSEVSESMLAGGRAPPLMGFLAQRPEAITVRTTEAGRGCICPEIGVFATWAKFYSPILNFSLVFFSKESPWKGGSFCFRRKGVTHPPSSTPFVFRCLCAFVEPFDVFLM